MITIKRAAVASLGLLLILSAAVPAEAQRGRARIPRAPGAGGARVGGGRVVHPWPAATCPICASRIAGAITKQLRTRGLSSGKMSTEDVRAWMRVYAEGVEVNPSLVRSRMGVVRDHESLSKANAETGGSTYSVEVESRAAPNGATTYIVSDGSGEPYYVGSNYKAMVSAVKRRAGARSINVRTRNFTPAKADALRGTLQVQRPRAGTRAVIEPSGPGRNAASARSSYATRGPRLVERSVTQPKLVRQGRFKGFYTATLRFVSAGRQLTLRVYAKSREALRSMLDTVTARLSNNPNRMSMERLVNQARTDLKGTYGLTNRDLFIQIEDELRNTFFVQIPRPALHKLG